MMEIHYCPFCGEKTTVEGFDAGQAAVSGRFCSSCTLAFRLISDDNWKKKIVWFQDTPLEEK